MNLEDIIEQVVRLLVDTFGFSEVDARHRMNLWKAEQHRLEGQALDRILPQMDPDEAAQQALGWILQGNQLDQDLRKGAKALGLPVPLE